MEDLIFTILALDFYRHLAIKVGDYPKVEMIIEVQKSFCWIFLFLLRMEWRQ